MKNVIFTLALLLMSIFTSAQYQLPGNPIGADITQNGNLTHSHEYFYNSQNLIDSSTVIVNNAPYNKYSNTFDSQGRITKKVDHKNTPIIQTWTYSTNQDKWIQGSRNKTTNYTYTNGVITSMSVINKLGNTLSTVNYSNMVWRNFAKKELYSQSYKEQSNQFYRMTYVYDTLSPFINSIVTTTEQGQVREVRGEDVEDENGWPTQGELLYVDTVWTDFTRLTNVFNGTLPIYTKREELNGGTTLVKVFDSIKIYDEYNNIQKDSSFILQGATTVINYLYGMQSARETETLLSVPNDLIMMNFNLFPNPSEGRITITGLADGKKTIRILNSLGVIVYSVECDGNDVLIDHYFLPGAYKVNVYVEKKLVKSTNVIIK